MKKSILKNYPKVVLIGRTNVGKSTLFNRLIEEKKALISPIAGTTRDLNYALCTWQGITFYLIDTAGLDVEAHQEIEKNVIQQTRKALQEADLVVILIDSQSGVLPTDKNIAREILASQKPYLVAANKIQREKYQKQTQSARKLGLGEAIGISALSGMGTGDLLDEIIDKLQITLRASSPLGREANYKLQINELGSAPALAGASMKASTGARAPVLPDMIKVAIIGKPNVGKSSLLNVLAGEARMVVSPEAFTTREPQDTLIKHGHHQYLFLDTVGLRKKRKLGQSLEKEGVKMSWNRIGEAE